MLVTEPGDSLLSIIAQAVEGGVDVVQWRDKRKSIGKRRLVLAAVAHAVGGRALLVSNGDWEANARAGARAIHLPERSVPVGVVRHYIGANTLVGKSVHSILAATQAEQAGADYLVAGTIFASPSHPDVEPAGLPFLRDVCAAVSLPVLAIGGITPENVRDCIEAGADGVAVLSPIMRAADPRNTAQTYRQALDTAWEERGCD